MTGIEPVPPILIAQKIPGGCEDCAAERLLQLDANWLWHLTVSHDDTCPTYKQMCNPGNTPHSDARELHRRATRTALED